MSSAVHSHAPEDENAGLYLTVLCWIGLAIATLDAFVQPLPPGLTWGALGLAFVTGGLPAARSALQELWHDRKLDIDLLMVVAALAAAAVGAALEGAVLLALFSLSQTLEHRAMGKARRAVEALMQLRPETALREGPAGVEEVAVEDLNPGDRVILRPGARVPVDGRVVSGAGHLDESTVTGESQPIRKGPGSPVHEATVNLDGILTVEVLRPLATSTVAQMIRLVTEAQAMKSPSERFSEWFGQRYTILVLVGSALAFLWFRLTGLDSGAALYRAATVLVAASPCAVVISVPAAILSALSAAARGGVLFKGGAALEGLAEVRTFAFDKTGTLTTGQAAVTSLRALEGTETGFLALVAGLEAQSEHPIASAIRREVAERGVVPAKVTDMRSYPSEGITGHDAEGQIWAGNTRMLARVGAAMPPDLAAMETGAETLVLVGRGPRILGALTVADEARTTAGPALAALKARGAAILMMTGDRRAVAERIGSRLGLAPDEIHAGLLPADKVTLVDAAASRGRVAFIGDGVNDAAALARADVGVAMGVAGSEVALQAADVALMAEDLRKLAAAQALARRTARVIRQNLTLALGAMALLVIGSLFFDLPLPLAVIGHEGGTLLVVLNGLRLLADPIRAH
ncbi:MAG: cadmium-translocating P-type ATPase [Paracoccaceae bacterium]|nr:cadmium-translocating P-type ATPase [Paracoccaceae bacterium]